MTDTRERVIDPTVTRKELLGDGRECIIMTRPDGSRREQYWQYGKFVREINIKPQERDHDAMERDHRAMEKLRETVSQSVAPALRYYPYEEEWTLWVGGKNYGTAADPADAILGSEADDE